MIKNIAVIGSNGFVGNAICDEILKYKNFNLIRITRDDDIKKLIKLADIVIYSANNSKRYYAENNPQVDFVDTVEKASNLYSIIGDKKIILISTVSARVQLDSVYGRNRRACELMLDYSKNLIVRLGPMYGDTNHKGALFDILKNKNVYVSEKTKYAYVNVKYNAKKIIEFLDKTGIIEIGAKNTIELGHIKKVLGSDSNFDGRDDTQILLNPPADAPDSYDVIDFAKRMEKTYEF